MPTNNGKEVICIKVPETNEFKAPMYEGMPGLIIVNEFANLVLLRNSEGAEGIFPRDCFKLIEELNIIDYLDTVSIDLEEARFIAEKQGKDDVMSEITKLKLQLQALRTDLLEETT